MMKFAEIPITSKTRFALVRGLIIKGNLEEFKEALVTYNFEMDEETFLSAVEDLCLNDKHFWLPEV